MTLNHVEPATMVERRSSPFRMSFSGDPVVSVREGTSQCKRMTPTKIDGREANLCGLFVIGFLGRGCPRGGGVPGEP